MCGIEKQLSDNYSCSSSNSVDILLCIRISINLIYCNIVSYLFIILERMMLAASKRRIAFILICN